jgi:class 3 adenylate cyclase
MRSRDRVAARDDAGAGEQQRDPSAYLGASPHERPLAVAGGVDLTDRARVQAPIEPFEPMIARAALSFGAMAPLYMDRHEAGPGETVSPGDAAQLHSKDLAVQEKYGVRYLSYWFDEARHSTFCLVSAPSRDAATAVHSEAHGLTANKIIEVDDTAVQRFLGNVYEPVAGEAHDASGLRTIVVTDVVDSTVLMERLGDREGVAVLRAQEEVIKKCLQRSGGRLVKSLGDGVLASFDSVVRALECSLDAQAEVSKWAADRDPSIHIRVGLAAGEPVEEGDDIFGSAVHLASRVCARCEPGGVLAASTVRDLAMGKDYVFEDKGEAELKGFEAPVRLFSVTGRK